MKKHFHCVPIFSQAPIMHGWEQPGSLLSSNPQRYPEGSSCQGPQSGPIWGGSMSAENRETLLTTSFHATVHRWLVLTLLSTRSPGSSSQSFYPVPGLHLCQGLFLSRCRTLHLSQMDFIMFLSAHSSCLSRYLWMAEPSLEGIGLCTRNLSSSAKLVEVHSISFVTCLQERHNVLPFEPNHSTTSLQSFPSI